MFICSGTCLCVYMYMCNCVYVYIVICLYVYMCLLVYWYVFICVYVYSSQNLPNACMYVSKDVCIFF